MKAGIRNIEEYSSSELSECESLSTPSDFSDAPLSPKKPPPAKRTYGGTRSKLIRRRLQVDTARRESARLKKISERNYEESSSSEVDHIRPRATRGKNKGRVIQSQSSSREYAPSRRYHSKRAKKQVSLQQSSQTVRGSRPSQRDSNTQQRYHSEQAGEELISYQLPQVVNGKNSQEDTDIQHGHLPTPREISYQENLGTPWVNFIDPRLLDLTFDIDWNGPLPPDTALLSIGKPIRIPIREIRNFQPCDTSHDEPCELALSDPEDGGDEMSTKSRRGFRAEKHGSKHASERREKRPYRKRAKLATTTPATPPYRIIKIPHDLTRPKPTRTLPPIPSLPSSAPRTQRIPRSHPIVNSTSISDRLSRFLIHMHVYYGQTPVQLTESANREFEDVGLCDNDYGGGDGKSGALQPLRWTVNEIMRELDRAMGDPGLRAYRRRWEVARREEEGRGREKGRLRGARARNAGR